MHDDIKGAPPSVDRIGKRITRRHVLWWTVGALTFAVPPVVLLNRWRNRRHLITTILLEGPFTSGQTVRINDKASHFVQPHSASIKTSDLYGTVAVKFRFAGPEHDTRRINVTMLLHGRDGTLITKKSRMCRDQRIASRQNLFWNGNPLPISTANVTAFKVPRLDMLAADSVEVRFEEEDRLRLFM